MIYLTILFECELTGKVTMDYLFYHSTECELAGLVTVDELFHFHNSNLVAAAEFQASIHLAFNSK